MVSLSDTWSGNTSSPLALMLMLIVLGVVEPGVGVSPTAATIALAFMSTCTVLSCFIVSTVHVDMKAKAIEAAVGLTPTPGSIALAFMSTCTVDTMKQLKTVHVAGASQT